VKRSSTKARMVSKAKHPGGYRYEKSNWLPLVSEMLARGLLYRDIAQALGVGQSTVCRFAWQHKLVTHTVHRNSVRHTILKSNAQA
jgi:hypothetical protein